MKDSGCGFNPHFMRFMAFMVGNKLSIFFAHLLKSYPPTTSLGGFGSL